MHGVQFLQTFVFAVNVERVGSALPDAVVRLVGWRPDESGRFPGWPSALSAPSGPGGWFRQTPALGANGSDRAPAVAVATVNRFVIDRGLVPVKGASKRRLNGQRHARGPVWQARFYNRIIRNVKEYHDTVGYMDLNPIRRELVAGPEDWPWSSIPSLGGPRPAR